MAPLNIFIVDDNQDLAESLADILEAKGHSVDIAFDGESAVKKFQEKFFDLTFMDVRLPGMNGVESFLEIRKLHPQANVVMMTGYSVEQLLDQAMNNGALAILHKPIDIPYILSLLEEIPSEGIIVVADDDPEFASLLRELLSNEGYAVLLAHNGPDVVNQVLANKVNVLILDLRLPILSGLEVYLDLKARDKIVPTIIVTGYAIEEANSIEQLNSLSVAGCLIKPFDLAELLQAIKQLTPPTN